MNNQSQPAGEKWPDEVRLKMIEKSEFYQTPQIYQYGYYDGYQMALSRLSPSTPNQSDELQKAKKEFSKGLLEWMRTRVSRTINEDGHFIWEIMFDNGHYSHPSSEKLINLYIESIGK